MGRCAKGSSSSMPRSSTLSLNSSTSFVERSLLKERVWLTVRLNVIRKNESVFGCAGQQCSVPEIHQFLEAQIDGFGFDCLRRQHAGANLCHFRHASGAEETEPGTTPGH